MKEYPPSTSELSPDEKRALLKKLLKEKAERESVSSLPAIIADPQNRYEPFPLTDIQYAYWIGRIGVFELGSVGTHVYMEFDTPVLNIKNLNIAWQRLIERHEMLRAIVSADGLQRILKDTPSYEIELTDLHLLDSPEKWKCLEANRQRMSHKIFKPDEWPLFDIKSFLTGNDTLRHCISFDLIFVDLMSFQVLLKEWFLLYQNLQVELEPLQVSFRDYVLAEHKTRNSEIYQKSKDYWFKRLPFLPPSPELAMAKSPASLKQYRFMRRHMKLDSRRWKQLKAKSQNFGLTPAAVLMAAFSEILTLWCKNPSFTLNLIIFNRLPLHPQINKIVGDFTSVNLLEIDNTEKEPFVERVRRLQKQLWNDLEHRYISGVQVLRELARINKWSGALMPVVFTCDIVQGNNSATDTLPSNIPMDYAFGISQTPQIFLDHQVFEDNGSLTVNWDAVDELFPEGLLQEMFEANLNLLKQLADDDELWQQSNLSKIPKAQLEQRLRVNETSHNAGHFLLQDLFLAQVHQQPGHQAIVTSGKSFTYKEVYNHSNQLARQLRKLGATANTLIAVVMNKGWEQVVAVLGILQAGAAYLPISPENPKDRVWYQLENGGVALVLTQSWLETNLEWPESVTCTSIDNYHFNNVEEPPLEKIQQEEDLAYVIYTSGSTGTPKGVMIDHKGAVNTIIDINQRFNIQSSDKVFAISSLSFDLSVYDIFGTLAAGATIVIPKPNSLQDPAHWVEIMNKEQVSIWNSAPALMSMLMEYVQGQQVPLPGNLRNVLLSGDWIPVKLPGNITSLKTDVKIVSLGGATEASIWSILFPIENIDPNADSIPYGKPMMNQQFHVLNSNLEPCPVWVAGKLYIGGAGLAKGYWKDEKTTAAKFFLHPHSGERLYNTGDLGCYLPDGNIKFLGRDDLQVKVNGHRIELGEIEAMLQQHPLVKESVAIIYADSSGAKKIYAFAVLNKTHTPAGSGPNGNSLESFEGKTTADLEAEKYSKKEILYFLKEKLPSYMIPAELIQLAAFPVNKNGKIDRNELPSLIRSAQTGKKTYEKPRNATEQQVADIWLKLLKIESVGIHDNFFDLGGDSLVAIQMINHLKQSGISIEPRELFQFQTIAEIALLIGKLSSSDTLNAPVSEEVTPEAPILIAIQPHGDETPLFMVHPSTGNIECYFGLSVQLGRSQPLYGLQSPCLVKKQGFHLSTAEMAALYLEQIKKVQPEGPYQVGGWSTGGMVAYEIAQQLLAEGREVALLALIDLGTEDYLKDREIEDQTEFFMDQSRILGIELPESFYEMEKEDKFNFLLERVEYQFIPEELDISAVNYYLDTSKENIRAMQNYAPLPYPGKISMFNSESRKKGTSPDPYLGWEKYAINGVDITWVPGDHFSMFRNPNISVLANELKSALLANTVIN